LIASFAVGSATAMIITLPDESMTTRDEWLAAKKL